MRTPTAFIDDRIHTYVQFARVEQGARTHVFISVCVCIYVCIHSRTHTTEGMARMRDHSGIRACKEWLMGASQ